MKILITEQQLSHIVKNSKLNEQLNIKKALGFVSVDELNTLKSEDIKRGVKKILDLCEKFEHNGGVYYIFQQIPSLSPENIILKDDRREIALYVKQTPQKGNYRQNIIFYNKLIFDNLLSKYSTNYIEYAIKYNIINVLIDENVITKKSFNYSINYYYANNNKNQRAYPLSEWFNKYVESKTTDEILNATRLKSLSNLDLDSMKGDEFSDEGLSGFDKFKRNVSNALTGVDEKESYFVSKLANIFDLAVKEEKYSGSLNIPDENGDDYLLLITNPCTLFLKNAPIKNKESLISYLESLKTIDSSILRHFPKDIDKDIFTKVVKKAVAKSSNKEIKRYIGSCAPGYPIRFR
jgi:hypothetical protein